MRFHRVEEALLALRGAVMAFRVAQQNDLALSADRLREALAAELSAFEVVGRDEADVIVSFEPRIEDEDRDLPLDRLGYGLHQRGFIQRGEHDARHAAADEPLHLRHLRVAVVLTKRSTPDDRGAGLASGALGARPDALP